MSSFEWGREWKDEEAGADGAEGEVLSYSTVQVSHRDYKTLEGIIIKMQNWKILQGSAEMVNHFPRYDPWSICSL